MDDQFIALCGDEDDDLKEAGGAIRADDDPPVRIFAEVVHDHRVFDGMENVLIGDAVVAGRRVDLHTGILYYESRC